jgi:hypothetical protein
VRISIAFDDAADGRCHCGYLVGGKINCRHGPDENRSDILCGKRQRASERFAGFMST